MQKQHNCTQSLERQWVEANQDLLITAIVLNVFASRPRLCFNTSIKTWKHHGLFKTIQRIYRRLFQKTPAPYILEEFNDYIKLTNQFSDEALLTQEHYELGNEKKQSPNPLDIWKSMGGKRLLREMALRLLQVVPNTAAIARLFSVWSLLHIDSAAKHVFQVTAKTAHVKADVNSQHQHRTKELGDGGWTGNMALSTRLRTMIHPIDLEAPGKKKEFIGN